MINKYKTIALLKFIKRMTGFAVQLPDKNMQ